VAIAVKLIRDRRPLSAQATDAYAGIAQVHASPCYDLLVSLRALYRPRTYSVTRNWAKLSRSHVDRAQFKLEGFDTALGYGAARLVPVLPAQCRRACRGRSTCGRA
jgi:hypothetical protein